MTEDDEKRLAAEDFIRRKGYVRCDIPACNCGSWHGGHAETRLMEIAEALSEHGLYPRGNTILDAISDLVARATQAESERDAECEKSMRLEAALRAGRNALRDANPAGKTIVDFLNVWLDQMEDRARDAESALAAARVTCTIEHATMVAIRVGNRPTHYVDFEREELAEELVAALTPETP